MFCCLQVQDDEGWIAFFPGPFANLTAGVDHSRVAPVIGSQWFTWHSDDTHYRYDGALDAHARHLLASPALLLLNNGHNNGRRAAASAKRGVQDWCDQQQQQHQAACMTLLLQVVSASSQGWRVCQCLLQQVCCCLFAL